VGQDAILDAILPYTARVANLPQVSNSFQPARQSGGYQSTKTWPPPPL